MSKWWMPVLLALLGLGYGFGPKYLGLGSNNEVLLVPERCEFNGEVCTMLLPGEISLSVEIKGDVQPLSSFEVVLSSDQLLNASVRFEMVGMDMGVNRYRLRKNRAGENWQASVMLPVCTADRSDWVAYFDVGLKNGESYRLEYTFTADSRLTKDA